jgi:aromatic ring-opening dioxygenase LigB subunit
MMTPHGPVSDKALSVLDGSIRAEFKGFDRGYDVNVDVPLKESILREFGTDGFVVRRCLKFDGFHGVFSSGLDHALMVPLYYLRASGIDCPVVAFSISLQSHRIHYQMGQALQRATRSSGRRLVLVASGDLSHRLSPLGPAGFDPQGAVFDGTIVESLRSGCTEDVIGLDDTLIQHAGECGLRPLAFMLGALAGRTEHSEVLSYEGPFGVGYCVALLRAKGYSPEALKPGDREVMP